MGNTLRAVDSRCKRFSDERFISCAAAIVAMVAFSACAAEQPPAPELKATVTLQRDEIARSGTSTVAVQVWLENSGNVDIEKIEFFFEAPNKSLELLQEDCKSRWEREPIDLGRLPAPEARRQKFCLHLGDVVADEEVNLAFAFKYSWNSNQKAATRVTVVEKKLTISLLGTASVAGVSLRLAALLLPGFFFFLALKTSNLLPRLKLDAAQTVTLSVLVSLVIVKVAGLLSPARFAQGMSEGGLLVLSVLPALLVAVLAGGAAYRRRNLVGEEDDERIVIQKVYRANGKENPDHYVQIRLKDGSVFLGALAGATHSRGRVLIGWFTAKTGDQKLAAKLTRAAEKGKLAKIAALARSNPREITLEPRNPLQQANASGQFVDTKEYVRRYPAGVEIEPYSVRVNYERAIKIETIEPAVKPKVKGK